jgi:hypothetical protein
MADFAKLVLTADTSGLKNAEKDLKGLKNASSDSAKQAESDAKRFATLYDKMFPAQAKFREHALNVQAVNEAHRHGVIDAQEHSKMLQQLERDAGGVNKGFSTLAKVGIGTLISATGSAVGAFGLLIKNSIDVADEISKASQKIGIGTEELSRLRYAADLAGVSFEGLQGGIGILSRNMFNAASGGKEMAANFARLGIEVKNADGSLRSSSDVLGDLAERFSKMPDGAQKTAEAMLVLGRSGVQMIPLLNGGRDALTEAMEEADKFGIVIDEVTGQRAEAFNDSLAKLQGAVGNLATQVAADALPVLLDFTNWLINNSQTIRDWANEAITSTANLTRGIYELGAAMSDVKTPTGEAVSALQEFREWVWKNLDPLGIFLDYLGRLGAQARYLDQVGLGSGSGMKRLSEIFADSGVKVQRAATATSGFVSEIQKAGSAAKATKSPVDKLLEEAKRKAEEAERAMQRLRSSFASVQSQLDPALAADRRRAEQRGIITDAARAGIGTQSERLRALGQSFEVTDALKDMKPMILDVAKVADDKLKQIGDSFGTMADRALQALDRLAQGIQRGDFLSILSGILGIGLQLGGMGLFGSKIATNINSQGKANGGHVSGGQGYIVGERGPEFFRPTTSGFITPNNAMGGGQQKVHVTVGVDPANGNITAFVDGQIAATAPAIMQGGAQIAQQQMTRQARRRT